MTPEQSCKFNIRFGKYRGMTLEEIATKHKDGPRYLDYIAGYDGLTPDVKEALDCFLAISWVAQLVERATEHHTRSVRTEPVENLKKPKNWWEK